MSWRHCALLGVVLLLASCGGGERRMGTEKQFNLATVQPTSNYRVVKRAEGASSGFWLLFIPIYTPSYSDAEADLYRQLGVPYGGANIANVVTDTSYFSLLLFTVPTRHVRADVVEFQEINPQAQTTTSAPPAAGSTLPANCAAVSNQLVCDPTSLLPQRGQ